MPRTRILRESAGEMPHKSWIAFVLLVLVAAFLGGSSRPDAVQIAALRPLAALFLIPSLYWISRSDLRAFRVPLLALIGLFGLMAIQLIPLPPTVWQSLPGRELVADLAGPTGTAEIWRPISMVPARTLNSLLSLIVPIAGILLVAASGLRRTDLLLIAAAVGLVNALLAIAQILSGGNDTLYFYAVTNSGTAVGLFANQNHSAVFGAITLLVIGFLLCDRASHRWLQWQRLSLIGAFVVVLIAAMTGGSRAGLLATVLALVASAAMFWIALPRHSGERMKLPSVFGFAFRPWTILALVAATMVAIAAIFLLFDRVSALRTLTDSGTIDDLRWRLIPALQAMVGTYWLFGAGFGSFEEVYHIYETTELLRPVYVNQAHNDWAQLMIEGGLGAVMILGVFGFWVARRLFRLGAATPSALNTQMLWIVVSGIIVFASLVDYPLRTPLFQLVGIVLVGAFCRQVPKPVKIR